MEAVTWRVRAQSPVPSLPPPRAPGGDAPSPKGERSVWLGAESGFERAAVWNRYALGPGWRTSWPHRDRGGRIHHHRHARPSTLPSTPPSISCLPGGRYEGAGIRSGLRRSSVESPHRGRRAGGAGVASHGVYQYRARVWRPLGRSVRPPGPNGGAGDHRYSRPHQLHGPGRAPRAARPAPGDARAGRRAGHQRPVAGLRPPERHHRGDAGLPPGPFGGLHREHLPRHGHRRPGHHGRRAGLLRGRLSASPLSPLHRRSSPAGPGSARRQRARARGGDGRLARPGQRQRRRCPPAGGDARGVRSRGHRGARRRDPGPERGRHARRPSPRSRTASIAPSCAWTGSRTPSSSAPA